MFAKILNNTGPSNKRKIVRIPKDIFHLSLIFIPYAALITITFITISCTALDPNMGSVILDIDPGYQINTVLPDVDMSPSQYDFHGEGPNGSSFDVSDNQLPVFQRGLEFGEWTISVNAKNAGGISVAQGVQTTTIHSGNAVTLLIPVQPITGYGLLDVTVLWNETEIEIPSLQGQLISNSGVPMDLNFTVQNPGSAEFIGNNIPTGYHTMSIQLFDNGAHVAGAVEVVRIVDNQTTSCVLKLNDVFNEGPAYPRLAMWWPDSWNQSIYDLARYDYIGWGPWDNRTVLQNLKELNPEQHHFMSVNLTEVGWDDWDNRLIMSEIPAEWFLTQVGTLLAEDIDDLQTSVPVTELRDSSGNHLFELGDTVACGFESMRVTDIDYNTRTILVERGFVRPAVSHNSGERVAAHISFWPGSWVMNMSTLCPLYDVGEGPERWTYWAIRNDMGVDSMDGFIIDRLEGTQSWLIGYYARSIDADCTNRLVEDGYEAFDNRWREGIEEMLLSLRDIVGDKPLIANGASVYRNYLNGSIYESCPGNWSDRPEIYEEWTDDVLGDEGYIHVSEVGYIPNFSLVETYEIDDGYHTHNPMDNPLFEPNYQRMRFGLTTALLGDGYFSYEIGTNGHGSLGLMWFDEYDNGGQGKGYLGYPVSNAFVVLDNGHEGNVFRRNFENGVVLCNPSEREVAITLEEPLLLIEGPQQPGINSGEQVTIVQLLPKDGRILLF